MICGIRERRGSAAGGLGSALAALPGRETDAFGRWADTTVAFGWRGRTFGEEGAESPRRDAASGVAITASVRLDGRAALCAALDMPGPDETDLPDSELLLQSYARWGRACPQHLLGDYAFALWDPGLQLLFCVRDHIGARPFYYASAGDRFVFASDIAAVLAVPGISRDLDEAALATRLTYGRRSLGARTCYRAVRRLPPGHTLSVDRAGVRLHRWWRPEAVRALPAASDDAFAEECLEIVTEAVRDRLQDGRSIGVHLSGGLDSSGVAVLATRELRRQGRPGPPAFARFQPRGAGARAVAGEYGAADPVCRQEALPLFCPPAVVLDAVASLRRDGTIEADPGMYEDAVQRVAAGQGVEVLLSGLGGDQGISFNGRGYYPQLLREGRVGRLWRELRDRSGHPVRTLLVEAALPLVSPGAARAVWAVSRGEWPFRSNVTFIHREFAKRTRLLPVEDWPLGGRDLQIHLLQRGHLSGTMGAWATSGARHGIEYRYPLLDRRVLEFALGLPAEQYRRGRWSRWLMRRALAPILPPEVCWNVDKRDPPRLESVRDAIPGVLLRVRGMIKEREEALSRGRYLDLPRLLEELDPERWRAVGRQVRKAAWNALRFLDF